MENQTLPHDLEIERAVIGACLLGSQRAVDDARRVLVSPEMFYHTHHRKVFNALCNVADKAEPVDQITVMAELERLGDLEEIGGGYTLAQLSGEMATDRNVSFHAGLIKDLHLRRYVIREATKAADQAYDRTVDVDTVYARVGELAQYPVAGGVSDWLVVGKSAAEAFDRVEAAWRGEHKAGVTTGIEPLDVYLDGLQKGELTLVAGRPSMGKTAFGLHVIRHAARQAPVAFVSVEMTTRAISLRLLCAEARMDSHLARRGQLDHESYGRLQGAESRLKDLPLLIADHLKEPVQIALELRRLKEENGIELAVVDYLQLLDPPRGRRFDSREREVAATGKALKDLAKELDIPIVALAQLNRAIEARRSKRPLLSDLRESGALEQDSDVVLFLHRPEYYEQTEEKEGLAEVIIGKHRNGPVGIIETFFDPPSGVFSDWT